MREISLGASIHRKSLPGDGTGASGGGGGAGGDPVGFANVTLLLQKPVTTSISDASWASVTLLIQDETI